MRPKEFVARVLDLFDFDMGSCWSDYRPCTFTEAALAIMNCKGRKSITDSGYVFVVESQDCLGHTVIRASMGDLRGSICFTYHDYDSAPPPEDVPVHEHIAESWDVPTDLRGKPEDIASLLTFLTLKTNYRIRHKTS